jgi:putative hydrolase of the HAD superfamily
MSLDGLKAIFFDLDNTLCNYSAGWESAKAHGIQAAYEVLRERHREIDFSEWQQAFRKATEEVSHYWEQPAQKGVLVGLERTGRALGHLGLARGEEWISTLTQTFYAAVLEHLELYPDADETLRLLRTRFTLGIITNGPADIQRAKIERLELSQRVDHVFISGELGIAKPDPKIFQRALELAEVEAHESLFVGDSPETDIAGAKEAGVWAAWINCKGLPHVESDEADFVIESLDELIDLVDRGSAS